MRSRRSSQEQVAEVARRRLELLSAELAAIRPHPVAPPVPGSQDGSGEPPFDGRLPGEPPSGEPPAGDAPAWPPPAPLRPRTPAAPAAPAAAPGRHAHRSVGTAASLTGWAQDRLPPTVQGRVRLSAAHLAVLCVIVAAGVALTAWWLARADGDGVPVAAPASARTAEAPPAAGAPLVTPTGGDLPSGAAAALGATPGSGAAPAGGASGAASATSRIVVDVTGKVHRPGIATLPQGARVVDALEAAGGPRRGASLASLNLARVLTDGEQIVVGVPPPVGVAAPAASAVPGAGSTATPGQLVHLNTADQAQLETLPGVGPVTAQAILDYRAEKGSFTSVDQLLEVSGIGDATLAKVSPYCTL